MSDKDKDTTTEQTKIRAKEIRSELEAKLKVSSIEKKLTKIDAEVRKRLGLIATEKKLINTSRRKAQKDSAQFRLEGLEREIDDLCIKYAKLEEELVKVEDPDKRLRSLFKEFNNCMDNIRNILE